MLVPTSVVLVSTSVVLVLTSVVLVITSESSFVGDTTFTEDMVGVCCVVVANDISAFDCALVAATVTMVIIEPIIGATGRK